LPLSRSQDFESPALPGIARLMLGKRPGGGSDGRDRPGQSGHDQQNGFGASLLAKHSTISSQIETVLEESS